MSAPALRPLRVGEILDAGIKVYLANWRTLMGLTATIVVPFQILSAVVLLSTVSNGGDVPRGAFAAGGSNSASTGASVVLLVTGILVGVLTTAACVKAVSDAYLSEPSGIGVSLRFALRRAGPLLWLQILFFCGLVIAFVLLIVPGIYLYAAWAVATPALIVEGCPAVRALGRSRRLVKGRWWSTAGVLLVANVLISIVSGIVQGVLVGITVASTSSAVVAVALVSLSAAVSAVLTRPFQAGVTTVLYYDLRVRHEGFDMVLLAEQLGLEPPEIPIDAPGPLGPESVGRPGGPPFWPPPPGWKPPDEIPAGQPDG
jgi:hypothetical protein